MPRAVVEAAMTTGIKRFVPELRIAVNGSLPAAVCTLISSTSTIAFLISIPVKLSNPSNAMKPNGCLVTSRPNVTPIRASGTHSQITNGCRRLLNRAIVVSTIKIRKTGSFDASALFALFESSYSPPHSSS